MGIKGLLGLITSRVPTAVSVHAASDFAGQVLAIDTNIFLYSFVAAIRKDSAELVDSEGNPTSHIKGILNRTMNLLEAGITPVYVLEGKAPERKSTEIQKRKERKDRIREKLELAKEYGDEEGVKKFSKQLVNVTKTIVNESEHLLKLLGVPVIQAPAESESQCAEFCKKGQTDGLITRDMDALPLACPFMLRNLQSKFELGKKYTTKIEQISLLEVLDGFQIEIEQFIDLCILLGCDYTGTIKGVGPSTALDLIKSHHSIENIIEYLKSKGNGTCEFSKDGFDYVNARELFFKPEVVPGEYFSPEHFKCYTADFDGAKDYLISKSFNPVRVDKLLNRCMIAHNKILEM